MQTEEFGTDFSKAILTGLFLGISATMICLVFAIIYRYYTGFDLYLIINWPATIFGCNLLLFAMGAIYYYFRRMGKMGEIGFIVVFLLLSAWSLWGTSNEMFYTDPILSAQFRGLLSGYIIILGVCTFLGIPFLYHNRKFMKAVI